MIDVAFLINTYNRQESCQKLVNTLAGLGHIVVLNDGCDYMINGCEQHFLTRHNGKAYYWLTVERLFSLRGSHQYYIMLPDDFLPVDGMVERAVEIWLSIQNPRKATLNLYTDRLGQSCWTSFKSIDFGAYYQTQWVDMCFFCEESFFKAVDIQAIPRSISASPIRSSGVGAMISKQLDRKRYGMYQVKEGLVIPQESHHTSQMRNGIIMDYPDVRPPQKKRNIIFDTRKKR